LSGLSRLRVLIGGRNMEFQCIAVQAPFVKFSSVPIAVDHEYPSPVIPNLTQSRFWA